MPAAASKSSEAALPRDAEADVRQALVGFGFLENVSLAFCSQDELQLWHKEVPRAVELANPLSQKQSHLRMTMMAGLANAARLNQDHGQEQLRLLELGRTFCWEVRATVKPEREGSSVVAAELDGDALVADRGAVPRFAPIPRLPPAPRDLSFFIDRAVPAAEVVAKIQAAGVDHPLVAVDVFDVYEGKGVPEGQKSLAVSLVFRDPARTLTDEEVDAAQGAIVAGLESLGARLRG